MAKAKWPMFFLAAMALACWGRALDADKPPAVIVGETLDVRVVNVEAAVTDRHAHAVHGLAPADFQLLVDGQEVPIDYFTEVRDGQAAATAAQPSQVSPGAVVGRSFLVFIDDGFAVAARRNSALRRLREDARRLRPGDQMAVIAFDGVKLEVLSGWTGNPAALAAAFDRAEALASRGNRLLAQHRSLQNEVNDARDALAAQPDALEQELEMLAVRVSPEAVTQLNRSAAAAAAALRGFELPAGRRIMLLLSGAWSLPAGPRFYAPLVDAANQLGYTLYPLDVATGELDAMKLFDGLAGSTGGHAVAAGGASLLTGLAEETGSYYWLGFTPSWSADNRRHAVEVRVRREGLEVRSRRSFSDLSRHASLTMKAESVLFFGGSTAAPGAPGPLLKVEAGQPLAGRGAELDLPVTLLLPVAALSITAASDGFIAEVPLVIAALDHQGGRVELPGSMLHFRFASLPNAKGVARVHTTLRLRRIDQHLVFAVPDAQSGAVLTTDLDFRPPS